MRTIEIVQLTTRRTARLRPAQQRLPFQAKYGAAVSECLCGLYVGYLLLQFITN